MAYVVNANIRNKRITSDEFKTKAEADKFARETNMNFKGANARVSKIKK